MNIKPILFSTPMVQAILEGRKTMTRRIMKDQPLSLDYYEDYGDFKRPVMNFPVSKKHFTGVTSPLCPYGWAGDVLWVRETWAKVTYSSYRQSNGVQQTILDENYVAVYKAGWKKSNPPWKPSIFMPKEACRIFLEITDVRVERLQDISEADAIREGIKSEVTGDDLYENYCNVGYRWIPAKESFRSLWIKINGKESWEANPWVWVIEFIKTEKPEI